MSQTNYPVSDHYDGRRFVNQNGAHLPAFSDVQRMLRAEKTKWPREVPVVRQIPPQPENDRDLIFTFIGHSTFLVQSSAGTVITDPVYATRVGPFGFAGPRRVSQPGVAFHDLPRIDVVLLSHNHYDHCDLRALRKIQRRDSPLFVTPLGNARQLKKAGATNIAELDWWNNTAQSRFPITLTPAQHFSARTPFDRNKALWGGFVFELAGRKIYFAGDTGYGIHFKQFRERLGAMDASILPIGAYEPRWFMKPIHMNPAEAVRAHTDVESRQSIACHFGAFQLTLEGIDEPVHDLHAALANSGIAAAEFQALAIGASLRL